MWGGWYEDADYMEFMKSAREVTKKSIGIPSNSVAELAVFVDEASLAKTHDNGVARDVISMSRRSIGLIGTPKDYYLSSDFDAVKDKYKAYIMLVPSETCDSLKIRNYAKNSGKGLFEITPKNSDVTVEKLREFCKEAGVFIYSDKNAVIYANESYVFIHTGEEGAQSLELPENFELVDVFSEKKFNKKFTAPLGKSYLLRKIQNVK